MSDKTPQYRTIGQAARELELPQHVLRFWEGKFTPLTPLKPDSNRRYYDDDMMLLLKKIKKLLYEDGYTVKGAQQIINQAPQQETPKAQKSKTETNQLLIAKERLEKVISELDELKKRLRQLP